MTPDEQLLRGQLAIFCILIVPAQYVFFKHGLGGFMGWLFVLSFCAIRIVGCAMEIHEENQPTLSTAALIVSSLGLSPILLALMGVLEEARNARSGRRGGWLQLIIVTQYHALVIVAIVLILIHASSLLSAHRTSTAKTFIDAGFALLCASWLFICVFTLVSVAFVREKSMNIELYRGGTRLLYAVMICLPFVGMRMVYATIVYAADNTTAESSFGLRVAFGVVTEFVVAIVLLVAGVMTRNLQRERKRTEC
ncbi:hypothetical protein ASPZODRAFT_20276 [Penicilliopsis zonata CBS 506.65]|uniref:DUF7702 domain-containing protein n=1 Tax=Penicilliopsis zonata CBS 506.65 TaxID=1073090 RepID=A0A1L9S6E9_9EURO|nr:hypothetical protein ASPZODRAFT_20276 [Penicilliopsis zonata CBS 506.65]OJJ42751.1 hypothetical protein ASPZODRAFT_20276 [Penicilliopsis zonata CBS 506.65]